jgi:prefoldin subunit 5
MANLIGFVDSVSGILKGFLLEVHPPKIEIDPNSVGRECHLSITLVEPGEQAGLTNSGLEQAAVVPTVAGCRVARNLVVALQDAQRSLTQSHCVLLGGDGASKCKCERSSELCGKDTALIEHRADDDVSTSTTLSGSGATQEGIPEDVVVLLAEVQILKNLSRAFTRTAMEYGTQNVTDPASVRRLVITANFLHHVSGQLENRIRYFGKEEAVIPLSAQLKAAQTEHYAMLHSLLNTAKPSYGSTGLFFGNLQNSRHVSTALKSIDRLNSWEQINEAYASGKGEFSVALIKDDIGNWNIKNFQSDPKALLEAQTNLATKIVGELAKKAVNPSSVDLSLAQRAVDFANGRSSSDEGTLLARQLNDEVSDRFKLQTMENIKSAFAVVQSDADFLLKFTDQKKLVAQCEGSLATKRKEASELASEIETSKADLDKLKEQNQAVPGQADGQASSNAVAVTGTNEVSTNSVSAQIEELEGEIKELEGKLSDLDGEISVCQEAIAFIENNREKRDAIWSLFDKVVDDELEIYFRALNTLPVGASDVGDQELDESLASAVSQEETDAQAALDSEK